MGLYLIRTYFVRFGGTYSQGTVEIKSSDGGITGSGLISTNNIIVDQGGDSDFIGAFDLAGSASSPAGSFTKKGAGTLTVSTSSGNNTDYTTGGRINLDGGTLEINTGNFFGSGAGNTPCKFNGGVLKYGSSLFSPLRLISPVVS